MPVVNNSFPLISDLVSLDAIPSVLVGFTKPLQYVFSKVYYKNLYNGRSRHGDTGLYSLSLVLQDRIAWEIPGVPGLALVIFPDTTNSNLSELPVTLQYRIEARRFFKQLSIQNINLDPVEIFKIIVAGYQITDRFLLIEYIRLNGINQSDPVQFFISAVNSQLFPGIPIVKNSGLYPADIYEDLLLQLQQNGMTVESVVIGLALSGNATLADKTEKVSKIFEAWFGHFQLSNVLDLFIPKFVIQTGDLIVALEFPRKIFKPVDIDGKVIDEDNAIPEAQKQKSRLQFSAGNLSFSSAFGFEFENKASVSFTRSQIGNTGLILQITNAKLDLSRKRNIPEATADGRPNDFIGAYITEATITLPEKWFGEDSGNTLEIFTTNLLVGTGGISGNIGLRAKNTKNPPTATDTLSFCIGKKPASGTRKGFSIGFSHFEMQFRQNQLLHSDIQGSLTIPKFKQYDKATNTTSTNPLTIGIEAFFAQDGDWAITAKPNPNPPANQPKGLCAAFGSVFVLTVFDLEVGRDDERLYLKTTSAISFESNSKLKDILKSPLQLRDFYIYSDGSFELKGGSIPLPDSVVLPLGPVSITVTAIHFGAHQQQYNGQPREYKYLGFDGGVSVDPGGVDARGEGVKFYFTVDDGPGKPHDSFMRIDGIGIDLIIPGSASKEEATLLLSGYLSLKEDEYKGSIKFHLPKAGIAGGASMAYAPKVPAFAVRANLELPTALPLGNTGLGIFGFQALFGLRYIADKDKVGAGNWYEWFKAPTKGAQDIVNKYWRPEHKETGKSGTPFTIGAGLSLATMPDEGKTFSTQLMLLLSIPNLYLLEGKANILGERVGLGPEEPPFYAMLAFAPGDSVELGIGVDYPLPRSGDKAGQIARLKAEIQAGYFFRDSRAWFLNIGTKSKPVSAELLDFLQGYCYLMLSASGIEAGAGVHYEKSQEYLGGTVKAHIEAYFDVWGRISFPNKGNAGTREKTQIGGGIAVGGNVSATVLGIGFYLGVDTSLTAEAPKPFRVAGSVELAVGVKLLVKKIEKRFTVEFVWEKDNDVDMQPILALPPDAAGKPAPGAGVHIASGKTYPIKYFGASAPLPADIPNLPAVITDIAQLGSAYVVPLDTYIDIQFEKALIPNDISGKIGGLSNAAADYEDVVPPVKGNRQVVHRYKVTDIAIKIANGNSWVDYHPYEAVVPAADRASVSTYKLGYWQKSGSEYSKIRLLAQTPFSYLQQGQPGWFVPEQSGIEPATLYCQDTIRTETCVDWARQYFKPGFMYPNQGLSFRINGTGAQGGGWLRLDHPSNLEVFLPEPCSMARIVLTNTMAYSLKVHFLEEIRDANTLVLQGYGNIESLTFTRGQLPQTVESKMTVHGKKIAKIVVEPSQCDTEKVRTLELAIDNLKFELQKNPRQPELVRKLSLLESELIVVEAKCCMRRLTGEEFHAMKLFQADLENRLKECTIKQRALDADVLAKCKIGKLSETLACKMAKMAADVNRVILQELTEQSGILKYLLELNSQLEPNAPCVTTIGRVCWLTERDHYYNHIIPGLAAIEADYQLMQAAQTCEKVPIWRPDSKYLVTISVSDSVNGGAVVPFYFGFQTKAPLGYFPKPTPAMVLPLIPNEYDMPEYMLKYYIDFGKSYPNADGRILYAKPLYYKSPTLRLFFNEKYASQFFQKWDTYKGLPALDYALEIVVKDPQEGIGNTNSNAIDYLMSLPLPDVGLNFGDYEEPPLDVVLLNNLAAQIPKNCIKVTGGGILKPKKKYLTITANNLKPLKLYTVVVNNKRTGLQTASAEVHRYNFQTSRYGSFSEHIRSYTMVDPVDNQITKEAKFMLYYALNNTQLTNAWKVFGGQTLPVIGSAPNLDAVYPDPFDRVLYGVWNMKAQQSPVCTEFTWISPAKGAIVALWIRSPEPFNDPKMPVADLKKTVAVLVNKVPDPAFQCLFSKDATQVLIMHPTLKINTAKIAIQFEYWLWDGWKYAKSGNSEIVVL